MSTDSHALSPRAHRIAAGQTLGFALPQGSEVFCRQGRLQLMLAPLALWEMHCGHALLMATGQSWRAPQNLWVRCACATPELSVALITPARKQEREPFSARRWLSSLVGYFAAGVAGGGSSRLPRRPGRMQGAGGGQ